MCYTAWRVPMGIGQGIYGKRRKEGRKEGRKKMAACHQAREASWQAINSASVRPSCYGPIVIERFRVSD